MNINLVEDIKSKFIKSFGVKPILVFSPGRINLIGEHTDYNEGFVFPAAIDKGIVAAINKSDSDKSSFVAVDANQQLDFTLNNTEPLKNGGWKNYVLGIAAEIQNAGKTLVISI